MFRNKLKVFKTTSFVLTVMFLLAAGTLFVSPVNAGYADCDNGYACWKAIGQQAATKAVKMMREEVKRVRFKDLIALSNAGYAEVNGETTMGALDGLSCVLGVNRGDTSLLEIHSAADKALWFAIYHKRSGHCVYLQVDPEALGSKFSRGRWNGQSVFSITVMEQINAAHLFANEAIYAEKFNAGIFGGNEFRIVTIANAVAEGAPSYAVRSFEFHDHYCPGVTSGILMAQYLKSYYPLDTGGSYFAQGVQPSCKEDALQVMLNATPGKSGYSVTYPTSDDIASWPDWAKSARNIIYVKESSSSPWVALVLGYQGGDTDCGDYTTTIINKLCSDLWYLENLDQPEAFVQVLKEIELPDGEAPKDYARPGVDPILKLDALMN